jgi:hypothetical protein
VLKQCGSKPVTAPSWRNDEVFNYAERLMSEHGVSAQCEQDSSTNASFDLEYKKEAIRIIRDCVQHLGLHLHTIGRHERRVQMLDSGCILRVGFAN